MMTIPGHPELDPNRNWKPGMMISNFTFGGGLGSGKPWQNPLTPFGYGSLPPRPPQQFRPPPLPGRPGFTNPTMSQPGRDMTPRFPWQRPTGMPPNPFGGGTRLTGLSPFPTPPQPTGGGGYNIGRGFTGQLAPHLLPYGTEEFGGRF